MIGLPDIDLNRLVPELVDKSLFEGDAMFPPGSTKEQMAATFETYFRVGRQAKDLIGKGLQIAKAGPPNHILDLPCGAGRITRWLRYTYPNATIYVSDISDKEMRFSAERFKCIPIKANNDFDQIIVPTLVDVAWCGSLITHLNAKRSTQLLDWLMKQVRPGGVLLVTTHGRRRIELLEKSPSGLSADCLQRVLSDYHIHQFGHASYHANSQGYGFSLTSLRWLMSWVERRSDTVLLALQEAWGSRQDLLMIKKIAS